MSYIEREGTIMLKPVACYQWDFQGRNIGLRFDFVDESGSKANGAFGWIKKNGEANDSIDKFTEAMEAEKFLPCEVKKDKPKQNSGFFYKVVWAADEKKPSLTPAQIRALSKTAAEAPPPADDVNDPPF